MCPVRETPNTVTVGHICLSCALYATKECPYGNHKRAHVTEFQGDIRGKCIFYMPIVDAENNDMVKEARAESEARLNVELYKRIFALSADDQDKLLKFFAMQDKKLEKDTFEYWDQIHGPDYAHEMVDDYNTSEQKHVDDREVGTKKEKESKPKKKKKDKYDKVPKLNYYKQES